MFTHHMHHAGSHYGPRALPPPLTTINSTVRIMNMPESREREKSRSKKREGVVMKEVESGEDGKI